jgi:hypothetical protein
MLRKYFIPIFIVVHTISCSGTKNSTGENKNSPSQNQLQYIAAEADGNGREWADTLIRFHNSLHCQYAFGTDNTKLYLMLKISDKQQQLKIIQGGLWLWLDESGKKKETTGIKYPIGGKTMQPAGKFGGSLPDFNQMKQEARLQLFYMELIGFKEGFNGKQTTNAQQPIRVTIDWDNKENMIYEAAIPLTALPYSATAQPLSISVQIKGLKMPDRMGGGMNGMQPPAGMMPPGGGQMPNRRNFEELTRDDVARFTYTLKP